MIATIIIIIVGLAVVGALLTLVNRYFAAYIGATMVKIINVTTVIIVLFCLAVWLLQKAGLFPIHDIPFPSAR